MSTVTLSANTSWYLYNFRASTLRALRERGDRVVCLAPEDDYSQRLRTELGCEWYPLSMDNQGSNPLRDLQVVLRLRRRDESTGRTGLPYHYGTLGWYRRQPWS